MQKAFQSKPNLSSLNTLSGYKGSNLATAHRKKCFMFLLVGGFKGFKVFNQIPSVQFQFHGQDPPPKSQTGDLR